MSTDPRMKFFGLTTIRWLCLATIISIQVSIVPQAFSIAPQPISIASSEPSNGSCPFSNQPLIDSDERCAVSQAEQLCLTMLAFICTP